MSVAAELPRRMSTARAGAQPSAVRRPALAVVPATRSRVGRTPFVAVVVSLLAAGLLGLLVLNTVLAQDAFRLHTLKQQARTLEDREQVLQREVEALRAPQALAARAGALGMVQSGPPAFLRLPDGAVLGAATPAEVPVTREAPTALAEDTAAEQSAAEENAAEQADGEDDR